MLNRLNMNKASSSKSTRGWIWLLYDIRLVAVVPIVGGFGRFGSREC